MIDDWRDDLTTEKSLAHVYQSSKALLSSTFNRYALATVATISAIFALFWIATSDWENSLRILNLAVDLSFDLTVQILGFLIGGFAIFATVSDYKLMVMLAKSKDKKTNVSVFKTIFFNFLSVFYIYVITLSFSLTIKIFSKLDLSRLFDATGYPLPITAAIINSIVAIIAICLLALCVIRLKSFIWNIYQAFIVFLSAADLKDAIEREATEPQKSA